MITGTVDGYAAAAVFWAAQGSAVMPGAQTVNARGAAGYGEDANGAQD